MSEQDLLIDCLRRLNRTALPYMLTGSMASNYWGIPRTTHDLDIVVELDPAGVPTIVQAFEAYFFVQESIVRAATIGPPRQFNVIDHRSGLKVDFWLLTDDPFERQMFARRVHESMLGLTVWIATAEDVILHKLYWNTLTPSDRQLGDAAGIMAVQQDALDTTYLRTWAEKLGVSDTLERLVRGDILPKAT
jgi:hypothetical protein